MHRFVLPATLLLLATAAARSRAEGLLEDCALLGVERLEEILALLEESTGWPYGGSGELLPAGFRITGFDLFAARLDWALDLPCAGCTGPDGTDDVTGSFRFEDAAGNPTIPFDVLDLLAGDLDLAALLASLPDGTVLITDFTVPPESPADPLTTGHVEIAFDAGMPSAASGSVATSHADCQGSFAFEGVDATDVLATYPTASVEGSIASPDGQLDGTIEADGTRQALVEMTLDQADSFRWFLDLDTFELVEAP
jgi:hypothetical protein